MADHHPEELAPVEARIAAIEAVLVEKGILDVDAVDAIVAHFEDNLGPMNGAKVVARAWTDPEYKARLLSRRHCRHRGARLRRARGRAHGRGGEHPGRAHSRRLHAVLVLSVADARAATEVVQAPAYRARAVREPRKLLAEMGTVIPDDVEIRVWDSSAEARYLVLPMRPAGTDDLSEEQLAGVVTRDSMIGVQRL